MEQGEVAEGIGVGVLYSYKVRAWTPGGLPIGRGTEIAGKQ